MSINKIFTKYYSIKLLLILAMSAAHEL